MQGKGVQQTTAASRVINISSLPWDLVLPTCHNCPSAPGQVRQPSSECICQINITSVRYAGLYGEHVPLG